MPLTGLFLIPIQPNQTSPASIIISNISRSHPAEPLPTYHIDHRLFVDTSSLLPETDQTLRRFTQILSPSHTPKTTYIGTSAPKNDPKQQSPTPPGMTMVTIPSSSTDTFTQLLVTKLQPHWAHRQSLVVDNGSSFSLEDNSWIVRIGDLRVSNRAAPTSGTLRGMLIELTYTHDEEVGETTKDDETMLRAFLDALIRGANVKMDNTRVIVRRTNVGGNNLEQVDWALAGLYMDMLRGSRG